MSNVYPITFTGIVVVFNEVNRLPTCLESLQFCDQIIVVDLGSIDGSVEVARRYNVDFFSLPRVDVVEEIHEQILQYAKNDWLILLDPDEVFPTSLVPDVCNTILENADVGIVYIPWQFYFKNRPLHFTFWGGIKGKSIVRHKRRVEFSGIVHGGCQPLIPFTEMKLSNQDQYVKHYWMDSYHQLFKKHWRYVKKEGEGRFKSGQRFSWINFVKQIILTTKRGFVDYKSYKEGITGIFLACFYTFYICMSLLSLRKYQRGLK